RQRPQDDRERAERYDRTEQSDTDIQRPVDEHLNVLGDTLVGIVGGVAEQLHAVVIGVAEPVVEVGSRHPAAPADLQPLVQIKLIDREKNVERGEDAEIHQLMNERVPVLVLKRVVKAVVPLIEQDVDADDGQFDRDYSREQDASGPAVFRSKIGTGKPPDDG